MSATLHWPTLRKTVDLATDVIPNFPSSVLAGTDGEGLLRKLGLIGYFGAKLAKNYGRSVITYGAHEAAIQRLFPKAVIHHFDHHTSHAACAFYSADGTVACVSRRMRRETTPAR